MPILWLLSSCAVRPTIQATRCPGAAGWHGSKPKPQPASAAHDNATTLGPILITPTSSHEPLALGRLVTYHDSDMPLIRPISDLRNKAPEIEELCHETGEPVFITKNGEGELVVMSLAAYERDQARLDLYRLLDEAETDVKAGDRGVSVATARRRLTKPRGRSAG
jgi:prevent-host-death family protein